MHALTEVEPPGRVRVGRLPAKLQPFHGLQQVAEASAVFSFIEHYLRAGSGAGQSHEGSDQLVLTSASQIVHPAQSTEYLEYLQLMPPPACRIGSLAEEVLRKVLPVCQASVCVDTFNPDRSVNESLLWYGARRHSLLAPALWTCC